MCWIQPRKCAQPLCNLSVHTYLTCNTRRNQHTACRCEEHDAMQQRTLKALLVHEDKLATALKRALTNMAYVVPGEVNGNASSLVALLNRLQHCLLRPCQHTMTFLKLPVTSRRTAYAICMASCAACYAWYCLSLLLALQQLMLSLQITLSRHSPIHCYCRSCCGGCRHYLP